MTRIRTRIGLTGRRRGGIRCIGSCIIRSIRSGSRGVIIRKRRRGMGYPTSRFSNWNRNR